MFYLSTPTETCRELYATLELMKLDMANFKLQQARPLIVAHQREYERDKFNLILQTQRGFLLVLY